MTFVCKMNRIDWAGNPGPVVRRDEGFEMDDDTRIEQWLRAGYIVEGVATIESKPKPAPGPKSKKVAYTDAETKTVKTP